MASRAGPDKACDDDVASVEHFSGKPPIQIDLCLKEAVVPHDLSSPDVVDAIRAARVGAKTGATRRVRVRGADRTVPYPLSFPSRLARSLDLLLVAGPVQQPGCGTEGNLEPTLRFSPWRHLCRRYRTARLSRSPRRRSTLAITDCEERPPGRLGLELSRLRGAELH